MRCILQIERYLNILKTQYLSDAFGTGRYFLTYEVINIQNNLLFNFFFDWNVLFYFDSNCHYLLF